VGLSEELRGRTKQYASAVIRCYVKLPKERDLISECQLFSVSAFDVVISAFWKGLLMPRFSEILRM
jgi:hypothetical protein